MDYFLFFGVQIAGIAASPAVVGLYLILADGVNRFRIMTFLPLAGFLIGLAAAFASSVIVQGAFAYTIFPFTFTGCALGYSVLIVIAPVAWLVRRRGGRLTLDAIMLTIALGSVAAVVCGGVCVFFYSMLTS